MVMLNTCTILIILFWSLVFKNFCFTDVLIEVICIILCATYLAHNSSLCTRLTTFNVKHWYHLVLETHAVLYVSKHDAESTAEIYSSCYQTLTLIWSSIIWSTPDCLKSQSFNCNEGESEHRGPSQIHCGLVNSHQFLGFLAWHRSRATSQEAVKARIW